MNFIDRLKAISVTEWVLIQSVFIVIIWLINPYLAKLISVVFIPIYFAILLISLIADKIEKSKISSKYYYTLFFLALDLLIIYSIFDFVFDL